MSLHRTLLVATIVAVSLTGCKPPKPSLAAQAAQTTLEATAFAPPNDVQTLTFTTGQVRPPKPYALDGFLGAKRWLVCEATEPGPFAREAVCQFNTPGRTYARANGWTSAPAGGRCTRCEVWTVPLAQAKLDRITGVTIADATHATVTYAYDVVPNELGAQLAAWMASNPVAWCGPDPRVVGQWSQPRAGTAMFVKAGGDWQIAPPPDGFAATFASTAAHVDRPCST